MLEINKHTIELLFKKHYSYLCKYAYSFIANSSSAEDIVQDVFLHIYNSKPEIKTSALAYLKTSVRNSCLNFIKKTYKSASHEEVDNIAVEDIDYNSMDISSLFVKIENAVEELPPKCKQVFIMRRNMQMSYAEISSELDISKKTIENHINTAIKKIKQSISFTEFKLFIAIFRDSFQ